ncbi:DUF4355 domain-containing protein, partial [Ligilactobacillus sp.]|uniref:DUF4355 domain-containing protein n=1 Tax=Ligilactobacillus sp. TaxID=2767921 RepID=UPI002FDFABF0
KFIANRAKILVETENAELHSTVESSKSAKGELDKQIADLQTKISGYETEKMKTRVALQSGLPLEFANRLRGDDEDSLKRDAETLAGYMQPKQAAPLKSTEPAVDDKGWGNMIHQLTNK